MKNLILASATLCTGLVAGVFYGFEVAVNPAFRRLPDAAYVGAMQAINEVIQNPVFALSFFGAPLLLPVAAAQHGRRPRSRRFRLLVVAAAVYLAGSLGVTVAANIPLNEALAAVPLQASSPAQLRAARIRFAEPWNRWHRIRTLASVVAFALAVAACLRAEEQP
ncbi:anthrone oxygenase family protein [Hymenobacter jeollabukensis]|uniref:DUF1772 domain-containing protein n=1 Tax=Hymenobacter jeollabukensis TaxID=2025313 RepID=A0A5R8WNP0_9BACT|nr:anthrone oxygenase family protein [Hymenobacter jeollabukensis]TLM91180.1 DUF1772 domain-containing protein [Hymenobacter jeollabukensis]